MFVIYIFQYSIFIYIYIYIYIYLNFSPATIYRACMYRGIYRSPVNNIALKEGGWQSSTVTSRPCVADALRTGNVTATKPTFKANNKLLLSYANLVAPVLLIFKFSLKPPDS